MAASLRGSGYVVICDAPQTYSSLDKIREYCNCISSMALDTLVDTVGLAAAGLA